MHRSKLTLLATAILALLVLPGVLWAGQRIAAIEVHGNARSDSSLIVAQSGLRVGEELTSEKAAAAIKRLYSLGVFSDIRIITEGETENGAKVVISVEEYPVLGDLSFEGNKKIKDKELKEELNIYRGQSVSPKLIKDAEMKIKSLYQEKGYLLVRITPQVSAAEREGEVNLKFRIKEGRKVKVKRINIIGNRAISDGKIKKVMDTKEDRWWRGGDFKEDKYEEDKIKIIELYRKNGYREAEILRDSLYYDESKENMFIDITLREGSQYHFGRISWEGNTIFSDREISDMVTFEEGEVYDQSKVDETLQNIAVAYQDRGYLTAYVEPKESTSGKDIDITFEIKEGRPSRVRKVVIRGNTKTKEKVIRRELAIVPGQIFSRADLERSQRNIMILNFFDPDVKIDVEPLENGDVDVIIEVKEKFTGTANMGVGYSERDKVVGTIGVQVPNLFGNGQYLGFNWDFGKLRNTFNISFTEPWLLDTPTSLYFNIYKETERWSSNFDDKRQGVSIAVGRRLKWPDDYSRVRLGYRLEQVSYYNFAPDYKGSLRWVDWDAETPTIERKWPETSSSVSLTYMRDSRDLPEFPTSGSVFLYTVEFAGGPLLGDVDYHKHTANLEFYLPTFWKFVLTLRSKAGVIRGIRHPSDVPYSERFFPGGASTDGVIRGYNDRSVGPIRNGENIGGRTLFIVTAEYQFPIVERSVYGLLFADGGNSWRSIGDTNILDLKRSLGIGVRIVVPRLGTIGFDIGYGFDNYDRYGNRRGEWNSHFQFGNMF